MTDITSACLLKHRQLIQCRRADLGVKVDSKLSLGSDIDCEELKMKRVDTLLKVLCRFDPDATLTCITNNQAQGIISYLYIVLPESC